MQSWFGTGNRCELEITYGSLCKKKGCVGDGVLTRELRRALRKGWVGKYGFADRASSSCFRSGVSDFSTLSSSVSLASVLGVLGVHIVPSDVEERVSERGSRTASVVVVTVVVETFTEI